VNKAIVFEADGSVACIHSSDLDPVLRAVGSSTLRRASHIEPYECLSLGLQCQIKVALNVPATSLFGKWFADLRPSGGYVEGPMDSREEALAFEIKWVNTNVLGLPDEQA
jgi:hypothetical protein